MLTGVLAMHLEQRVVLHEVSNDCSWDDCIVVTTDSVIQIMQLLIVYLSLVLNRVDPCLLSGHYSCLLGEKSLQGLILLL